MSTEMVNFDVTDIDLGDLAYRAPAEVDVGTAHLASPIENFPLVRPTADGIKWVFQGVDLPVHIRPGTERALYFVPLLLMTGRSYFKKRGKGEDSTSKMPLCSSGPVHQRNVDSLFGNSNDKSEVESCKCKECPYSMWSGNTPPACQEYQLIFFIPMVEDDMKMRSRLQQLEAGMQKKTDVTNIPSDWYFYAQHPMSPASTANPYGIVVARVKSTSFKATKKMQSMVDSAGGPLVGVLKAEVEVRGDAGAEQYGAWKFLPVGRRFPFAKIGKTFEAAYRWIDEKAERFAREARLQIGELQGPEVGDTSFPGEEDTSFPGEESGSPAS